jgi:6-pyruvoyltetrahydropterin/6-carboxytetrahydropterin synthase
MRIRIEETFDAATSLPGHDRCADLHGHTYKVEVVVSGEPKDGVVADFRQVRGDLRALLKDYDHKTLNAYFDFPSCENICAKLASGLKSKIHGFEMVRIWEGEGKWVEMDAEEVSTERRADA